MEQIKKMIVYAVDQALKDLEALLDSSWLAEYYFIFPLLMILYRLVGV